MTDIAHLLPHIEQVFLIQCTRCKYEGIAYDNWLNEAARQFATRGWTGEPPRVFCPMCNGKKSEFA